EWRQQVQRSTLQTGFAIRSRSAPREVVRPLNLRRRRSSTQPEFGGTLCIAGGVVGLSQEVQDRRVVTVGQQGFEDSARYADAREFSLQEARTPQQEVPALRGHRRQVGAELQHPREFIQVRRPLRRRFEARDGAQIARRKLDRLPEDVDGISGTLGGEQPCAQFELNGELEL